MVPGTLGNQRPASQQRGAAIWIGFWVLLFSLVTPVLPLQATDAVQTRTSQEEQCDQGFVPNERTGACEPIAIPAQIQAPPECEDGTILNRDTGECEPEVPDDLQQAPEGCPQGQQRDEATGECLPVDTGEPPVAPECPDGTELNQDTGRCDPIEPADVPPAEPTQPPLIAEPTQEPASQEATQENLVTVKAFRCPLGAPPEELGIDLMNVCTDPKADVPFTFGYEVDESDVFSEQANANGIVEWYGPPVAGGVFIQEAVPAGYLEPYAFCADVTDPGPLVWNSYPSLPNGLLVTSIPETPSNLECRFYNIPVEGVSVTIHKWNCPPDASLNDPSAECTEAGDGVTFAIDDGSAPDPDQTRTTGDDGPGTVTFAGLEPGTHTVAEEVPAGVSYATAWCVEPGVNANVLYNPPRVEFELEEGDHVTCDWYNVRDDSSSITIRKWTCPSGYEIEQGNDPLEDCTDATDGVTFHIDDGNAPNPDETRVTGDDGPGTVTFDDLSPGTYTVTEEVPDGIAYATGWCASLGQIMPQDDPPGLVFDLWAGVDWECHFLNIPDLDRTVLAYKGYCPEGFQAETEDFDDWIAACHADLPVVDFDHTDSSGTTPGTTWNGAVGWQDVEPGENAITEHAPPGYGSPIVFCSVEAESDDGAAIVEALTQYEVVDNTVTKVLDYAAFAWTCYFFNIPEPEPDNRVSIWKWQCPEGASYGQNQAWYEANCTQPHGDVWFMLSADVVYISPTDANGLVEFDELPNGVVGVQENIPTGFGQPDVYCDDGSGWQVYAAPTGYWELEFLNDDADQESWTCHVYNIPGEPGSVTIRKWTCPPGYDLNAAGADPRVDCTEATNGVEFQFGLDDLAAIAELQTTGDVIDGGVIFDDLEPDTYKAVELVPDGVDHVFALECTGHIMGQLQPYPLQMGNVLNGIDVDAGEHLVCDWYNVPERDGGKLTLYKYICTTETFISEVDCEIYEDGATFDLLWWDGAAWQVVDTQVTDGFGQIVWVELEPGDYWLDEHGEEWCHIEADSEGDMTSFPVNDDDETEVHVYNCDPDWSTTDEIPEKYPNTGAPTGGDPPTGPSRLPSAPLLPALIAGTLTRRRLFGVAASGLALAANRAVAQYDQVSTPTGGTPVTEAPYRLCFPATPDTDGAVDCARGAVPATLRIPVIAVDAPVEILETVAGVMEQPSDELHVAWYKETARLGEIGNMLIAGHFNWWGIPEAVFYRLGTLRPGDEVVLFDEEEDEFRYVVEWVRQESNLEPPREEVVAMTDHEAVTLITCGGEWNNQISEYDERTVVRAVGGRSDGN